MAIEPIPTRGAGSNPANRFEKIHLEPDLDWNPEEDPLPRTQFLKDRTSTIISRNDSPDVGFEASVNPYRGCEHGCIYCYARPFHEYLGFSSGLDFETKIMVKEDAPQLLREELASRKWKPQVIPRMTGRTRRWKGGWQPIRAWSPAGCRPYPNNGLRCLRLPVLQESIAQGDQSSLGETLRITAGDNLAPCDNFL